LPALRPFPFLASAAPTIHIPPTPPPHPALPFFPLLFREETGSSKQHRYKISVSTLSVVSLPLKVMTTHRYREPLSYMHLKH
jgi:hypothetical protein